MSDEKLAFLLQNIKYLKMLYEKSQSSTAYFYQSELLIPPHILKKFSECGLIKIIPGKKNRYVLHGKAIKYVLDNLEKLAQSEKCEDSDNGKPIGDLTEEDINKIKDSFKNIVGHNIIKTVILRSIKKKTHVLLYGPPSVGKSIFLDCIYEALGEDKAAIISGSSTTQAGLFEVLRNPNLRVLLIDELDKISSRKDIDILHSVMAQGYAIKTTKYERELIKTNVCVIATANDLNCIRETILSRFIKLCVPKLSKEEFRELLIRKLKSLNVEYKEEFEPLLDELYKLDIREAEAILKVCATGNTLDIDLVKYLIQSNLEAKSTYAKK